MKQFIYIENPDSKEVEELILKIDDVEGVDFKSLAKKLKKSGRDKWRILKAFTSKNNSQDVLVARMEFKIKGGLLK
jgi:hypothetical protein